MSRSGYTDDYEHMNLYRATVQRTINGKKGQAFLKDLAKALDEMPEKKLIVGDLVAESGEVCAIGAGCKTRGLDVSGVDVDDAERVGKLVGISRPLAAEIEFENDEGAYYRNKNESPEERWVRVRKWVSENITTGSQPPPVGEKK